MSSHAITILGHDKPGIIAETTRRLAQLGLNLEDSTMTLLRGQFAMVLVTGGAATTGEIQTSLAPLGSTGDLSVTVRELAPDDVVGRPGSPYVLTVHGGDRPGIVSAIADEVARAGGNITDLSTRLAGELYLLVAELDLPVTADPARLGAAIGTAATELGVSASFRPVDTDEL